MKSRDINELMRGNRYKICFESPYNQNEKIVYGIIINFNPSAQIVFYEEDKMNVYIIPYRNIKWVIPNGLSKQLKEKIKNNA